MWLVAELPGQARRLSPALSVASGAQVGSVALEGAGQGQVPGRT